MLLLTLIFRNENVKKLPYIFPRLPLNRPRFRFATLALEQGQLVQQRKGQIKKHPGFLSGYVLLKSRRINSLLNTKN